MILQKMVTAKEKTKLHDLDRQITSLVKQKETVKKAKEKELLELDWKIEKCTGKILKILKKYDDSDDDDDECIKVGDWVKVTGGVKSTVNVMMTVYKCTEDFYWLEDEDGEKYRRAKTNVKKVKSN